MKIILLIVLLVAACGNIPTTSFDEHPPVAPGPVETPTAVTANPPVLPSPTPPPSQPLPGDVPSNGECLPDLGQWLPASVRCQIKYTCRVLSPHTGVCRPAGYLAAGALTPSLEACGANMMLISDATGQVRCALICYPPDGQLRCGTQTCVPFNSEELGVCQ